MKIKLCGLCILALCLFAACKKQKNDDFELTEKQELFKVAFQLTGFTETNRPFKKLASTTGDPGNPKEASINQIVYVLLNENKTPIDTFERAVKPSENQLNLELEKGNYTLRAIGFDNRAPNGNVDVSYLRGSTVYFTFQAQYIDGLDTRNIGEVFTLQQDLQIEKDTTYSELNLNRFSVRLEVNVEDEIPEGISYIDLSVNSSSNLYMTAPDNSAVWAITRPNMMPTYVSRKIPVQELIGLSNVMFAANYLLAGQNYGATEEVLTNVQLKAYDLDKKLVLTKELKDVKFIPNHITRLSGKLFDELDSDKGVTIPINIIEDYDSEIINVEF